MGSLGRVELPLPYSEAASQTSVLLHSRERVQEAVAKPGRVPTSTPLCSQSTSCDARLRFSDFAAPVQAHTASKDHRASDATHAQQAH